MKPLVSPSLKKFCQEYLAWVEAGAPWESEDFYGSVGLCTNFHRWLGDKGIGGEEGHTETMGLVAVFRALDLDTHVPFNAHRPETLPRRAIRTLDIPQPASHCLCSFHCQGRNQMKHAITATSISQSLYDFLNEWRAAAEGGVFLESDFSGTGLCSESSAWGCQEELRKALPYAQFRASVNEREHALSEFPFNNGNFNEYAAETHGDRVHLNKQRRAWVNAMLKLPIRN